MRVSVLNWQSSDRDADTAIAAIGRCLTAQQTKVATSPATSFSE
jgi:hypothetical protein